MTHEFTEKELKILTSLMLKEYDRYWLKSDSVKVEMPDKEQFLALYDIVSSLEPSPARASLAAIVDIIKNYDGQIGVLGSIQEIAEAGLAGIGPDEI